jgi:ABC-type multidrug transport system fused ATPase/permease subunit
LLSASIIENLKYGNENASLAEVTRATQIAGIHDFITNLPNGYQTLLGENGVNLSEGQKQRLSLARALIKDPDILILDEPTSAQDSLTEKSIFDQLPAATHHKTLIIIAHRLSTINAAAKILVLNEKRLAAAGSPAVLFDHCAIYRSLVINQKL